MCRNKSYRCGWLLVADGLHRRAVNSLRLEASAVLIDFDKFSAKYFPVSSELHETVLVRHTEGANSSLHRRSRKENGIEG